MTRAARARAWLLWLLVCGVNAGAHASVALSGTRLIFNGGDREAGIQVTNRGEQQVLIQSRLSAPEDDDDTPPARRRVLPFVVTPHLQQLAPGSAQMLRVLYQGQGMPEDRESLLHLYVTQVPQRRKGVGQLNIAVRQRINLFYRPPGLGGDPAVTAERLRWVLANTASGAPGLEVSNPTGFHASLQAVSLGETPISDYLLLAPGARHHWPLTLPIQARQLRFKALTDYGGQRDYCAMLTADSAFSARLRDNTQFQEKC